MSWDRVKGLKEVLVMSSVTYIVRVKVYTSRPPFQWDVPLQWHSVSRNKYNFEEVSVTGVPGTTGEVTERERRGTDLQLT